MRMLLMVLVTLSLTAAADAKTFYVTLYQPSIVGSVTLQPGEYKLDLDGAKVIIRNGAGSAEAEVKVENAEKKFSSTSVRYQDGDGNSHIQEIRLGGTKTRLIFGS
jgi:hypothetical protein